MSDSPAPLPPGTRIEDAPTLIASFVAGGVIGDRYEIVHMIARGGFGEVYRARDTLLERECAIKILASSAGEGGDGLLQEARTAARLDHPNIVPVYDVGRADGRLWIAMRLIVGDPLSRAFAPGETVPLARIVSILGQAADAIAHAHRKGIIHRDVKPQNLLVERRDGGDHVWLTDFGIATVLAGASVAHALAGTPGYMAPEQISGRRVDARTDIFALGCIAYELFTGARAFRADSYSELVFKVVHTDPPDFGEARRRFGADAEAFLRKTLAKSPDDRFSTMEETALALRRLEQPARAPARALDVRKLLRRAAPATWSGRDVVSVHDLKKRYVLGKWVLDGASFQVDRGAIYALLGRNGSGKTTAIRTMLGLYARNGGEVRIFGRDPQKSRTEVLSRVGYVPETFAGYDSLRVPDYLGLVARFYPNWDQAYCNALLGRYALPLTEKVKALSRGERTKLSLVAALSHKPDLLLLDDPTLGLDAVVLDEFFETLGEASQKLGTTILLSTHNMTELEPIATHAGFLADGKILLSDTLDAIRLRTREVVMTFADEPPDVASIPEFRVARASGRKVTGIVLDTSSGAMERLRALQPVEMNVRELTLREIFVSLLR